MDTPQEAFDHTFTTMIVKAAAFDPETKEATTAFKNLETLRKCQPHVDDTPESTPEPTTVWGKTKRAISSVWDNETTRVLIKASGAFAGVGVVTYATVKRDHVIEKQALAQANQRNS